MDTYILLRRWFVVGIILLFVGIYIVSTIAQNPEKPLSTSRGNWLYVGGSGPGNYTKIQDALNSSSMGDTVFVYHDSSPYKENIYINTTVTLLGENQTTTQLNGRSETHTITVNAPKTIISGLTITQPNNIWENSTILDYIPEIANIYLTTNDNTIINNTLINGIDGIYCLNCSNITIKNITIFHAHSGFYLWQTSDSSFENNSISNCYQAVYGFTCRNCLFFNNTIYRSYDGIYMVWGDHNTYQHNNLYDNTNVGMDVNGDIQYNIITNSTYGAFVGKGIFAHNIVQNCNLGMESTGFILISYNTIQNCSFRGLMVAYFLTIVSHNNFLNNSQDASSEQAFLTRWHGNYWEKPLLRPKVILGYFGFGYIAIPWINFDWHPAKEPYDISEMI